MFEIKKTTAQLNHQLHVLYLKKKTIMTSVGLTTFEKNCTLFPIDRMMI